MSALPARKSNPSAPPESASIALPTVSTLPRIRDYAGIFLLSAAVLLFELALTRIFSVTLWSNLAFMVVSTALFGFGLSGVFLALRPPRQGFVQSATARFCVFSGAAMIGAFFVVNTIPFEMWKFGKHPEYFLNLAIWELALVCPFFFAGLGIAGILSKFPLRASRLYGVDLLGAAVGSSMLVLLITPVGGEGLVAVSTIMALAAALCFSGGTQRGLRAFSFLAIIVLFAILPAASHYLPLSYFSHKRRFAKNLDKSPIFETRWSSLSRVDIGTDQKVSGPMKSVDTLAIWIDGGTNNSVMLKWDGNLEKTEPMRWLNIGLPYALKTGSSPKALIIGSAGGREVLFALSNGAGHVDAIEMDPSTVHFVQQPQYAEYMGHLYQQPKVNFVNDEGRAYLKRQPNESYDVIQSVNNYTPVAMAAGALNLSETFLFTKEAFNEFLDHLTPNGIIALHRGAALRVALTAEEALRERGVEHPENHIIIANGDYEANQTILIKKSEWTEPEIAQVHDYLSQLPHYGDRIFLWLPAEGHNRDPFYVRVLTASVEQQEKYYRSLGLNLTPTTDDKPFLEHFLEYGRPKLEPGTPPEFLRRTSEKWMGIVPRGDFPYIAILIESAVLATIFLGLPLLLWSRGTTKAEGFLGFMTFFASLGFGFIAIEICLMKRYVLFLGHPAYSITTVILMLLFGAGIGSIVSERFGALNPRRAVTVAVSLLAVGLLLETQLSPIIFNHFLSLDLTGRIFVSALLLLPLGVLMGMPFTLGIALMSRLHEDNETRRHLVAWAWAVNGYTTVIGSAATVFLALFYGFSVALAIATAVYVLGMLSLRIGTSRLAH